MDLNICAVYGEIRAQKKPYGILQRYPCIPLLSLLPVLVKAIPCTGKDLGMSTVAYASLMVELQQDGYTLKTRES